jgi:catalase
MGLDGVPGVVPGDDAEEVLPEVQELMAGHRVWDRFPTRT